MAKLLTDAGIKNRKPSPGKRIEDYDRAAPGLVVRTTPTGAKTYAWRGRIKGQRKVDKDGQPRLGKLGRPVPADPIIITIGPVVAWTLDNAREEARGIWKTAQAGKDPRDARRPKVEEAPQTFGMVAETFIRTHVATLRSKSVAEANIRRYLIPPLKDKPITSDTFVTDIRKIISDIRDGDDFTPGKPLMARAVFSQAKKLFDWTFNRGILGTNPITALSGGSFDFTVSPRAVTLEKPEQLQAFWNAADATPYPAGPYFQMLLLSGQRRSEVAGMKWSELDLDREQVWIIPAERMKGTNEKARAHEVPLSPAMLALLLDLRETRSDGDFVFSTDGGKRPMGNFHKLKTDLDAKIKELSPGVAMPAWTIHDLRRTMRTNLGAIPSIPENVAERVIAHVPGGIVGTYNVHQYRDEKRRALTSWSDRLASFVNPAPIGGNVVAMKAAQ